MSKPELGTKRTCPETGRKFYDLGKDPITSPYTGQTYPISFFEVAQEKAPTKSDSEGPAGTETENAEAETDEDLADAEVVSLEEADDAAESKSGKIGSSSIDDDDDDDGDDDVDDIVLPDDDDDLTDDDEDDDAFLPDDDDEDDDDVSVIIGVGDKSDDEN